MPIIPVNSAELFKSQLNTINTANKQDPSVSFVDVFKNAVNDVNTTDEAAKQSQMNVVTGQTDDLPTLMVNTTKADLALQTLVQMRNKALDAYNDIMKITL